MTSNRPEVDPTGLYNQSQVARLLMVDRHTVKRYEDNGNLKFKTRKAGRQRVTTGQQVLKCWQSMYL